MNWRLAAFSLLCLWASAPPAWFPGGGLLVLLGWMSFYAGIQPGVVRRAKLQAYLVGALHMAAFSFSVRHVMLEAYLAIALLGGCYYVLMVVWTRALGRWVPTSLAFGLALAGAHWLRGHFTEIQYPHCQPVHCLYQFPELLGSLTWGSEILGNVLLGVLAAGLVDLYRAWRVGVPGHRRSLLVVAMTVLVLFVTSWAPGSVPAPDRSVRIAALEPGFTATESLSGSYRNLLGERVLEPSRELLRQEPAPDLLIWPESIYVHRLLGVGDSLRLEWMRSVQIELPETTRLLAGTTWAETSSDANNPKVIAVLSGAEGRYLGHHEKRRLVPGGEHQPFLDWLPTTWSDAIRQAFESAMGQRLPDCSPGEARGLLTTAASIPFGAMICFDNAFPEVSEDLVAAGASFLTVLSNESWYRGGAELDQMEAMSVCRALECRVPIIRCTVDGASMVVGPSGRVERRLPPQKARSSRYLTLEVAVSSRGHRATPPLHALVWWTVFVSLLALLGPILSRGPRSSESS